MDSGLYKLPVGSCDLTGAGSCAGAASGPAGELRLFHPEGAAIGAAKKLQLAHVPLQILNHAKELRLVFSHGRQEI